MRNIFTGGIIVSKKTMNASEALSLIQDGDAIAISAAGMIGYPELNPNGIRIKHEWRPYFRQGGMIDVESIVPNASGIWKIIKMTHQLQSFGAGEAWDTTMEGMRINA